MYIWVKENFIQTNSMKEVLWKIHLLSFQITWDKDFAEYQKIFEKVKGKDYLLFRVYKLTIVKFKKT